MFVDLFDIYVLRKKRINVAPKSYSSFLNMKFERALSSRGKKKAKDAK